MVRIEISEEVWQKFRSACAVNAMKSYFEVIDKQRNSCTLLSVNWSVMNRKPK